MRAINRSFRIGAGLTVVGIFWFWGRFSCDSTSPTSSRKQSSAACICMPDVSNGARIDRVQPARKCWTVAFDDARRNVAGKPGKRSRPRNDAVVERASSSRFDGNRGERTVFEEADRLVPVQEGLDLRPAFACLVGIVLTLALMFCTEYWTSTEFHPVRSITKNSRTGDATNIIQGIAVGYESTVWAVILIAAAVFAGVFIYPGVE